MKRSTIVAPALVLFAGLMLTGTMSFGKPEYTKTEKKPCATCHVSAKSKDLNDVGKCYAGKKSLKDCAQK